MRRGEGTMSIYMSIGSVSKKTVVHLPNNTEKEYELEIIYHHACGTNMSIIEIKGVNRNGEQTEVVVDVWDLLGGLAQLLIWDKAEGWKKWSVAEDFKKE